MRFLIAGLGSIGRRHFRNLVALGENDIVLFRTGKSTLPDDDLHGYPVEHDLAAALGRTPDAVIVANPTALHLDVATPAARAGCHLLIEKPISNTLDGVDALVRAASESGSRILIGYQYRFHPGLRQAKAWVEAGAIGRIVRATAEYGEYLPSWHPWEDHRASYSARSDLGGGATLTLSHTVDTLRWLAGPVSLASARGLVVPEISDETEAVAELQLELRSGGIGLARMDYLRSPKVHRVELVGTEGSVVWDEAEGSAILRPNRSAPSIPFPAPAGFDRNDLFISELAHFIRVARDGEAPVCPLEESLEVLGLLVEAKTRATESPPLRRARQ